MSKKIKNILFWVFLAVVLFCNVSLAYTKITQGKSNIFGVKPLFVVTESMEPTIRALRPVISVPVDAKDVQIGDIVTYKHKSGMTIVHRVIEAQEDGTFIFKGDNNSVQDPQPVTPEQIGYRAVWYPSI